MSDRLVKTIKSNLDKLYDQMNGHDINTVEVKTALCAACNKNKKVYTFATGVDSAHGDEWLYDVTALRYNKPKGDYIIRTVLVAESEWGCEREILNDFQKLMVARADVRVMVFDGTQKPRYRKFFKIFAKHIAKCEQSKQGDIWLFAAWMPKRWKFHRIVVK